MQSTLDIQSTLDMSHSSAARPLSRNVLELQRAKTTTSALQLEVRLQAALVDQVPQNHGIIE